MHRQSTLMSAMGVACFTAAGMLKLCQTEPPASVEDAKSRIESAGFYCMASKLGDRLTLIVSNEPFEPDPESGLQWQYTSGFHKGKVFVFMPHNESRCYPSDSREWGDVRATGDSEVLKKLDALFR